MSDTLPASATELPGPAVRAPTPRARNPGAGLALLLGAVALLAAGYAVWRAWELSRTWGSSLQQADAQARGQANRIATLERDLAATAQLARAHERKLADAENLNRSLREEVLGLGERAGLLEDAVASLADRRQSGAVVLKLDEAAYLLRLGQERLVLFDDPVAAISAFRLADAQLAELDDAVLAGVRQTIAAELQALAEIPVPDRAGLVARVDSVIAALPRLPTRLERAAVQKPLPADAGYFRRLGAVLGQFVRVRRVDGADAALVNPLNAQAMRAAIALELQLAKAALAAGDGAGFNKAIASAHGRIARAFAADAAGVQEALATLASLEQVDSTSAEPAIGRALEELTNLRATRALSASTPADAPVPQAEPAEQAPPASGPDSAGTPEADAQPAPAEAPPPAPEATPEETPEADREGVAELP